MIDLEIQINLPELIIAYFATYMFDYWFREGVAARVAEGSWEKFSELVASLPAGNDGYIGFFIDHPEIIPTIIKTGWPFPL